MRCFVAADLDTAWCKRVIDVRAAVTSADEAWAGEKWVDASSIHITLAFFADLAPQPLEVLARGLSALATYRVGPLENPQLMAIPDGNRARMLWMTFDESQQLRSVYRQVRTLSRGCVVDDHPFKPHVTLVRARRTVHLSPAAYQAGLDAARLLGAVSVPSVSLYRSILGSGSPRYERLARQMLDS